MVLVVLQLRTPTTATSPTATGSADGTGQQLVGGEYAAESSWYADAHHYQRFGYDEELHGGAAKIDVAGSTEAVLRVVITLSAVRPAISTHVLCPS